MKKGLHTSAMYPNFPTKKYDLIYIDPPWQTESRNAKEYRRGGVESHYETLTLEELKSLPIDSISHSDTIIFMWIINSYLMKAQELFKAWNFEYKDVAFVWGKTYNNGKPVCGMGWTTRRSCELLLIGYKAKRTVEIRHARLVKNMNQLVLSEKREHSRKPDIFRKLISDLYGGKAKLEIFARKFPDSEHFEGWETYGDVERRGTRRGTSSPLTPLSQKKRKINK